MCPPKTVCTFLRLELFRIFMRRCLWKVFQQHELHLTFPRHCTGQNWNAQYLECPAYPTSFFHVCINWYRMLHETCTLSLSRVCSFQARGRQGGGHFGHRKNCNQSSRITSHFANASVVSMMHRIHTVQMTHIIHFERRLVMTCMSYLIHVIHYFSNATCNLFSRVVRATLVKFKSNSLSFNSPRP